MADCRIGFHASHEQFAPSDLLALARRAAAADVRPEDMADHVAISADPAWHAEQIAARRALGFDEIYLHNVGRNQAAFIEAFGREVLPALAGRA